MTKCGDVTLWSDKTRGNAILDCGTNLIQVCRAQRGDIVGTGPVAEGCMSIRSSPADCQGWPDGYFASRGNA